MFTRVIVKDFKNFKKETIVLAEPLVDKYFFDVIVGRNGSGKSCLLEAIEFCLCNKNARDLRAANMRDLVNVDSLDGKMEVTVELISGHLRGVSDCLKITRSFNGKSTKLKCLLFKGGNDKICIDVPDIPLILTEFGISPDHMNGIRIKQNQSTVACLSPLALLEFIETMCGSIEQKKIIELNRAEIESVVQELQAMDVEISALKCDLSILTPVLENIKNYFIDVLILRRSQTEAARQNCMLLDETAELIQCSTTETSKVLKDILCLIRTKDKEISANNLRYDNFKHHLQAKKRNYDVAQRTLKKYQRLDHSTQQDIDDKETNYTENVREVQNIKNKIKRLESKITGTQNNIKDRKSTCERASTLIKTFEMLIKNQIITPECLNRFESYWSVTSTLEGMNKHAKYRAEQQELLDQFDKDLAAAIDFNGQNTNVMETAKERICTTTDQKKCINDVMVQCKQDLYSIRQQLDSNRQIKSHVSSQLIELTELKDAKGSSSALEYLINSLKTENTLVAGKLLQLASPSAEEYGNALLSVLGKKALKTVVVETRECAVKVADNLKCHNLSCSTIIIANELTERSGVSLRGRISENLIPLINTVSLPTKTSQVVYRMLLSGWVLFMGNGVQYKDTCSRPMQASVVCLDGCQYLADGEINLSFSCGISNGDRNMSHTAAHRNAGKETEAYATKQASLYWPTEVIVVNDKATAELQSKLAITNCNIADDEGRLKNCSSQLEDLESKWRQLNSIIDQDMKIIEKHRKLESKLPKCPVVDRQSLAAEQAQYTALLNEKQRLLELILSSSYGDLNRIYCGEKVGDLLLHVVEHRHELMHAESEIRILEDDILFSVGLLSSFEIEKLQKQEDISTEQCALLSKKISLVAIKEACGMALEDQLGSKLLMKIENDNLRFIGASTKQLNFEINELKIEEEAKQRQLESLGKTMKEIETSRQQAMELKTVAEADVDRILDFDLSLSVGESSSNSIVKLGNIEQINSYIEELAAQSDVLKPKENDQDLSVLTKCHVLEKQIACINENAEIKRVHIQYIQNEIIEATSLRFRTVSRALSSINISIASFYDRLVDGGECYLSYASDTVSLFTEGVQMTARCENRPWTNINKLSGGQQSACGVSLLLSFQDVFPSPVYFLDEIDAYLDTRTAFRVGELLKERSIEKGTQFIAVSHHPQLHVNASRIIGFYHLNGISTVVSATGFD